MVSSKILLSPKHALWASFTARFSCPVATEFPPPHGTAAAALVLCCDIQLCSFVFALLELPNPTRTAMAFKVNVVSRRNRAVTASF
jgi:hypothetical protein